jgi:hypothetical protein
MRESQSTQAELKDNLYILDQATVGIGEQFLEYIKESKRWQADLINAIHRDSSSFKDRGLISTIGTNLERDERLQKQLLERLCFPGMTDRQDRIVEAHKETFRWIFESPKKSTPWPSFTRWLQSGSGLYWITGKAGSGKSTLMKYIYNDPRTLRFLWDWCGDAPLVVAAFYFWNSGVDMQMSEMGLLQAILHQLLISHRELIPRLFPERWEAYSLFSDDPHPWSQAELRRAFGLLAEEDPTATKFCFFIDGLDELDGDHSELNSLFRTVASSSHIKICVSSRPWNVFEDAFGDEPSLMLQDLTYQDINLFVNSNFKENVGFAELEIREPIYAATLKERVCKKAEGVFLWVLLVVKSLLAGLVNGDRVSDLERRLDLLPPDLGDLYYKMLQSLDPFYYAHASQLFQLTRAASSPLSLLTLSFADEEPEYVFKCKVRALGDDEKHARSDLMRRRLNSRCKGLLETPRGNTDSNCITTQIVNQNSIIFANDDRKVKPRKISIADSTVQYLHRTVKEFLEQPRVWKELLRVSPLGYNPRLSICRAFVTRLKYMDPETLDQQTFWEAIKICIEYARVEKGPTEEFVLLLKELDKAASKLTMAPCHDGSSFLSYYSRGPRSITGDKNLHPHWTCTFSGYEVNKGLTFLSLAVKLNLQYYVREVVEESGLVVQDSGLWSLLRDAITYESSFVSFFEIKTFPNISMIKLLLDKGADPNWARSPGNSATVFEHLLEQATIASGTLKYVNQKTETRKRTKAIGNSSVVELTPTNALKFLETSRLGVKAVCSASPGPIWIECIYEFLTYGADPSIDLEAHMGLSFLGATKSDIQVVSNKSWAKSRLGIGPSTMVYRESKERPE